MPFGDEGTRRVPDGGWGWVVVCGLALTNVFNQSLMSVFGLLFKDQLDEMGQSTTGVALVLNLHIIVLNFSGFFTKQIISTFSLRKVAVLGNVLCGVGIILSSQATRFQELLLFYGVLTGFGMGLLNASGFLVINLYFKKHRGKALGLAMAGTGLGQMIMPFVVRFLLEYLGYRGATLVIGALSFHGLIGSSSYRNPEKNSGIEEQHLLGNQEELDDKSTLLLKNDSEIEQDSSFCGQFSKMLDLKLLKDFTFMNLILGLSFIYTVSINFSLIFPYFLQETVHLSPHNTALAMSTLAGLDLFSRLTIPRITDRFEVPARISLLSGIVLLILARFVLAESSNFLQIVIFSGIFGFVRGTTIVNQNLSLAEYCTGDKSSYLASALGLAMIFKGFTVITLGESLGFIRDFANSYELCFHIQNLMLVVVVCLWLPEIIFNKYCTKQLDAENGS